MGRSFTSFRMNDPEKQREMQNAALAYSHDHLASWQEVLAEDLFAIWSAAAHGQQREAA